MKNTILTAVAILALQLGYAQTKTETVARWGAGPREVKKYSIVGDSTVSYLFFFRNAMYQHVVNFQSVTIGDLGELKTFVETIDSLLTNVKLKKGESFDYSIGKVKNINVSLFLGKTVISICNNSMRGCCFITSADVKKMRAIYTTK
jgi:hypothetical protein